MMAQQLSKTIEISQIRKDNLTLTISIVTYNPNIDEFYLTLKYLSFALTTFSQRSVKITIVDNSEDSRLMPIISELLSNWKTELLTGHGNIGFGKGHNLALSCIGDFHLILNPDIQMDCFAIVNAINFLYTNDSCGLVTPRAYWPSGSRQYLCKRYPSVLNLILRGFAPKSVQIYFDEQLARYEMRAETQEEVCWDPPIVSGCFMLFRRDVILRTNGFDPKYFLYFEDFDLSLRSSEVLRIAYVPNVEIVHSGGNVSKKGAWHIYQFARSSLKFYTDHGFKLF